MGIVIFPYYLFDRSVPDTVRPIDTSIDCEFVELGREDVPRIAGLDGVQGTEEFYHTLLDRGQRCFGLCMDGELLGFCWADFNHCHFTGVFFRLEAHEVYAHDVYTLPSKRGRSIAPLLNAYFSKMLLDSGVTRSYSIIDCFNHPSLHFAAKIGCRKLRMGLYIELFELLHRSWVIKIYRDEVNIPATTGNSPQ